jgi:hypothetical protein
VHHYHRAYDGRGAFNAAICAPASTSRSMGDLVILSASGGLIVSQAVATAMKADSAISIAGASHHWRTRVHRRIWRELWSIQARCPDRRLAPPQLRWQPLQPRGRQDRLRVNVADVRRATMVPRARARSSSTSPDGQSIDSMNLTDLRSTVVSSPSRACRQHNHTNVFAAAADHGRPDRPGGRVASRQTHGHQRHQQGCGRKPHQVPQRLRVRAARCVSDVSARVS